MRFDCTILTFFTYIHPLEAMAVSLQLFNAKLDHTVAAASCREYRFKTLQGLIQIDFNPLPDSKWTDTAHCMSHQVFHFFKFEHFCLAAKLLPVLFIINLSVACRHHQHHTIS